MHSSSLIICQLHVVVVVVGPIPLYASGIAIGFVNLLLARNSL